MQLPYKPFRSTCLQINCHVSPRHPQIQSMEKAEHYFINLVNVKRVISFPVILLVKLLIFDLKILKTDTSIFQWSATTLPGGKRVRKRRVEISTSCLIADRPVKSRGMRMVRAWSFWAWQDPSLFMMLPRTMVCSWLVEPDKKRIAQSPTGNLHTQKYTLWQ